MTRPAAALANAPDPVGPQAAPPDRPLLEDELYRKGIPVAFVTAATVIAVFVTRVTSELGEVEVALNEARQKKARSERLEALGTLAAGPAQSRADAARGAAGHWVSRCGRRGSS